jgi:hypothetical protein
VGTGEVRQIVGESEGAVEGDRATLAKEALDHAWNWFALHATQRLQSVNFFLVAIAFLSAAFVTAIKEQMHLIACGISILAVCICFFFYRIERRIRSLVHAAEEAMSPFEAEMALTLGSNSLKIVQSVETPRRGEWTYSKVFRWLYGSTAAAFLLGFVYVVWKAHGGVIALVEFKMEYSCSLVLD